MVVVVVVVVVVAVVVVVVVAVIQFCRNLDCNLCDNRSNARDCLTGLAEVFGQLVLDQPLNSALKLHCELLW